MKWIYRGIVLVLLTGSMLLNGLQYVGSAMLDGVYSLAEGVTGVASAGSFHRKEAELVKQKRLAQGAKLKGLQSKVNTTIRKAVSRGARRVGIESVPIPGEMLLTPAFVAMEIGFVYQDIKDQCEVLDELNSVAESLEFETQTKPEYCSYTPTELATKLPNEVEFSEAKEKPSVRERMNEYGRQIYSKIKSWSEIYRDTDK